MIRSMQNGTPPLWSRPEGGSFIATLSDIGKPGTQKQKNGKQRSLRHNACDGRGPVKNPQIKRSNTTEEYSPEMIQDLLRAKKDPVFFMRKFVKIQHPKKGTINFNLFEYQERFVRHLEDNRFVVTLQPRQCGKTLTVAMYLLWYACFTPDVTVLIASKNQSHALEIAARVRFAYEELPNWIKPGVKYYNRHNLEMENGSRIISEATTEKTGRGLSISKLYLDELAFIQPRIQEDLWSSLVPTLSTGGSAIISSTPNGDTELFAQLWRRAMSGAASDEETGSINFAPFQVHWREHPERDDKYYQMMLNMLGELQTRQEVDCEFLSSDALLVSSLKLQQMVTRPPHHTDMGFKFWKAPEEIGGLGKTYMVSIDPATGTGKDFSVIEVFDFPNMEQIAEWRSNEINIPLLYAKVKWVLNYLSQMKDRGRADVVWTFERNGIGEAMCALYINDEKIPEHPELYSDTAGRYGVYTSGKTKILSCLQMKTLIEKVTGGFKLHSDILLFELKNFVAKGGTYEGKKGSTDDCVSALIGITRLLKRLADYNDEAFKKVNEYVDPDVGSGEDDYGDEPIPFSIV